MVDQTSPFSFNIRQAFLNGIVKHVPRSIVDTKIDEILNKDQEIENQPPITT